jgi:hypothetical protein
MSILALTSDTLIGTAAAGNLEYDGQFFGTDSNASRAQLQRIVRATAVASTSGTSISFTAIPAWVERITIMFRSVSLSGSANPLFQLGTGSTTYTTSGYLGASSFIDVSVVGSAAFTAGFGLNIAGAGNVIHGSIVITNIDSNIWVASGVFARSDANTVTTGGSISLGAALTAVRVTTSNGTDTFDAGSVNIIYEG